ncbi:hypothetical protein [Aureibacter tunicatorum]|uniref:Lipoprotein n=1 Tax=Aureibacter tunicatorum TaxID=866807 RepID=A0AAE3XLH6_9BACT|nr:hypothetical protein [Aureibacter tunicatorum]MDR6238642.1 hypothetical protein [Aureibacter tunicatorum]BDD05427.1 hypothetical protein AUTU_29100 [Aureibacter tunicatorum]
MKKLSVLYILMLSLFSCVNNENPHPVSKDIKTIQNNMWEVEVEDPVFGISFNTTMTFPEDCPQAFFYKTKVINEFCDGCRPPVPDLAINCVLFNEGDIFIGDIKTNYQLNKEKNQLKIGEAVLKKTNKFNTKVKNPYQNVKNINWLRILNKSWNAIGSDETLSNIEFKMHFSPSRALAIMQFDSKITKGFTPGVTGFKFDKKGNLIFLSEKTTSFKLAKYLPEKVELEAVNSDEKITLTPIKL